MLGRIAAAVPLGAAVTAILLFTMHRVIETGQGELEPTTARIVDFVRIARPEAVETREQRRERPAELEPVPDLALPDANLGPLNVLNVALATPTFEAPVRIGSVGFGQSDGEYLPIVKVAPIYPVRALQRKLEGYVIVEFVVTSSGSVRDVSVVESTSEVFESAAVEAALKFKYKPRIIDGVPIEVAGVRNQITFRLGV